MTQIYQLSDLGRQVSFADWLSLGGGGSNSGRYQAAKRLGAESHWTRNNVTLGQIEDASPAEGRTMARFAVEMHNRPEWAKPYTPFARGKAY